MSLKPLLQKQTLRIDDHKRGTREIKNWDDDSADIHIDKRTKYKVDGKIRDVTIRIPINSNRPIRIDIDRDKNVEIPNKLYREIRATLDKNPDVARQLARDVMEEINDYQSKLTNEEKASAALNRISNHFGLEWTKDKIATFINDKLHVYTQIYRDNTNNLYFMTMNPVYIEISDITGWSRHDVWLTMFR